MGSFVELLPATQPFRLHFWTLQSERELLQVRSYAYGGSHFVVSLFSTSHESQSPDFWKHRGQVESGRLTRLQLKSIGASKLSENPINGSVYRPERD